MIDETETRIQTPTDIPTDTPMVTVTATAAEKVRELLDQEGNETLGLRVFVAGGGCSGLQYGMTLDESQDGDEILETAGIRVLRRRDERAVPDGQRDRLCGQPDGRWLHRQQPAGRLHLWLRP